MPVVDLTHPITPNMPVYPGTEPPRFVAGCSIDEAGFLERKLIFYSHTGTHIDAPAHLLKGRKTLDMLPIDHFFGPALRVSWAEPPTTIGVEELLPYRQALGEVEYLLVQTGWSGFWGSDRYFIEYPVLSIEAATWLTGFGLKGVGLDTISADALDSQDFPVHKILLGRDILIVENLAHLDRLTGDRCTFCCLPLSLVDADGSPVRAVAFID